MDDYNLILNIDSYKSTQSIQYENNIVSSFHYMESRGGMYDKIMCCFVSYLIKKYLSQKITKELVLEAKEEFDLQGITFPLKGWMQVVEKYNGVLPIVIRAPKEGTIIPYKEVCLTIQGFGIDTFWIASWIETMVLRLWYPMTVATRSFRIKQHFKKYHEMTSDSDISTIDYKLHDFGARASTSYESSLIAGSAHLFVFKGTDTVAANRLLRKFYNATGFISASAAASEHSTITSWGRTRELKAFDNLVETFGNPNSEYKTDFFSCVSDSYDIYNAIENYWGKALKDKIKEYNIKLVARPDSGDPVIVPNWCLESLWGSFGGTFNTKGFKVIDSASVLQGDGLDEDKIVENLEMMVGNKQSIDNIVFGMGGELHQKLNRDTNKFALKCSAVLREGSTVWDDVYKDPIDDKGKTSKKGRLDLIYKDGKYQTVNLYGDDKEHKDTCMITYYDYGVVDTNQSLSEIRKFVDEQL